MTESFNIIENFYTEERRIQGIVNEAVNEALNEQNKQYKIELENQRNRTIINLSEKFNYKPEEIAEVTNSSLETVNEVLKKSEVSRS